MEDKSVGLFTKEWLEQHEKVIDANLRRMRGDNKAMSGILDRLAGQSGWASDEEQQKHAAEMASRGTAMCRVGEDGFTYHVPRHEWSVFEEAPSPPAKAKD